MRNEMASGGRETIASVSSSKVRTRHCQLCESEGKTETATGYCRDCRVYLCQRCRDYHSKSSKMKEHEVEGFDGIEDQPNAEHANMCEEHGESISYHCRGHGFFGCHVCQFKLHNNCQGTKYIPDVAKEIISSEEYCHLKERLKYICSQCQDLVTEVAACRNTAEASQAAALAAFKARKGEIIDALDKLEKEFTEKADELKQEELARLAALSEKLDSLSSQRQRLASTLELLQDQERYCDLYITMVKAQDTMQVMEKDTRYVSKSTYQRTVSFNSEIGVVEKLRSPFGLGDLQVTSSGHRIKQLEHVGEINVECTSRDGVSCFISSSVQISNGGLMLVDCMHDKVKLWDPRQNKVVSELDVPGACPWGVCRVSDDQVAVTLYKAKMVALLGLEPGLVVDREISVKGGSRGVGYCDGNLVVRYFSSRTVEIIDLQGQVLKVIENRENDENLLNYPYQLCVNPDNKRVYVTNWGTDEVLCLSLDGAVVGRYKDRDLIRPSQVIVDRGGTVYVCGQDSHNVHQVTGDCEKVRLLLTQEDGLKNPVSICYDESEGRVYIGQYTKGTITVYKTNPENV